MKIIRYMCEKFDKKEKGFVTIEDIKDELCQAEYIFKGMFLIVIFIGIILIEALTGSIYNYGLNLDPNQIFILSELLTRTNLISGFSIWFIIVVIIVIIDKFWTMIKTIKIVKYPLKKE